MGTTQASNSLGSPRVKAPSPKGALCTLILAAPSTYPPSRP